MAFHSSPWPIIIAIFVRPPPVGSLVSHEIPFTRNLIFTKKEKKNTTKAKKWNEGWNCNWPTEWTMHIEWSTTGNTLLVTYSFTPVAEKKRVVLSLSLSVSSFLSCVSSLWWCALKQNMHENVRFVCKHTQHSWLWHPPNKQYSTDCDYDRKQFAKCVSMV